MRLTGVKVGDIVLCDVRGDRFYASVRDRAEGGSRPLEIGALTSRPIPALKVSARQVVGHWRRRKGSLA